MQSRLMRRFRWAAVLVLAGLTTAASGAQAPERPANRLAGETSPYLLQHARNPVDWYPWGPEAFARAKKEGKPVFLSVGYSACHWCHVMERESFEDEGVAKLLNDHFVSIKVDREERPDVDEIYMTAVQLIHGRGGWPMSVFLTPDAKPFYGGTYFPRTDFAELLRKIQELWSQPDKRQEVEKSAEELAKAIGQASASLAPGGTLTPAVFETAVKEYLESFDPVHGGFNGAPKFPPSMRLALLLERHARKPDAVAVKAAELTLDRMARGGMYDQVGGGFHRYSVDEKWLVPHFEKMLYDNALLSWVYLEGARITRRAEYRRTALETLDFVLRELADPEGGFWSTLDADSPSSSGEKEEGLFYLWKPADVIAALGKTDGALFNRIYDVTEKGNFEGSSIPNLLSRPVEEWARELKTTPEALRKRLDGMRARLLAAREKRPRPSLDDKVLASWNGLVLRSLALAYDQTGAAKYRTAAERAAAFLLTKMRRDGRLVHSYRKGKVQPQSFLEDYSFVIVGLLELHRATGEKRWLEEARALAGRMVADFWDEKGGTFFTTPHHHEALLTRLSSADDNATPSGQSMAALALVRLGRLTEDAGFRTKARRLLETHAGDMRRQPQAMPNMLLAAHAYFTADEAVPLAEALAGEKRDPDPVSITVEGPVRAVKAGEELELKVWLEIQPGWHVNSDAPGDPALVPTRVELAPGAYRLLSVRFPKAGTLQAAFAGKPVRVFSGKSLVVVRVKAQPGVEKAKELRLKVRYQACNDQLCRAPVERVITVNPGTP